MPGGTYGVPAGSQAANGVSMFGRGDSGLNLLSSGWAGAEELWAVIFPFKWGAKAKELPKVSEPHTSLHRMGIQSAKFAN